jgi:hypothetical protein
MLGHDQRSGKRGSRPRFDLAARAPEDAAQLLIALEARQGELYHPSDDELAAIEEGLAQVRRGEAVEVSFKP